MENIHRQGAQTGGHKIGYPALLKARKNGLGPIHS
jgi:hypothetical protein